VGVVYSPLAMKHAKVPVGGNFRVIRSEVERFLAEAPFVKGAIHHGSSLRGLQTGNQSPIGDFDCFVLYDSSAWLEAGKLDWMIFNKGEEHCVQVNTKWLSLDQVRVAPRAELNLGYVHHLRRAVDNGGTIKADITGYLDGVMLKQPVNQVLEEAKAYVSSRLSLLFDWCSSRKELKRMDTCLFLSKVLDSGVHVARRALEAYGYWLPDDGSDAVLSEFENVIGGTEVDCLRELMELKSEYQQLVRILSGGYDASRYEHFLEKLEQQGTLLLKDFLDLTLANLEMRDSAD